MSRLDPMLECVEAYVRAMRDYRLFLIDVRPLVLELQRIWGFQAEGRLPIHAVLDLDSAARVLAGEAAWRLAARRSRTLMWHYDDGPKPCRERTSAEHDPLLHHHAAADGHIPLDQLDELNPYLVIVLAYLYGAIGSHATAVDELLAHVDRIRDALVRRPELSRHRPLLLWFSLRAVIEASVLAEQDSAQPQKAEMMRRLLSTAVDLAREAGAPEPWDFAARCRNEGDPAARRIAFTLLNLRARLLQAAAAAGRTGAAEHAEAVRLAAIDLDACFAPLFAGRRDDIIRSVAAMIQVTRARLALAWSAAARSGRLITDDEARSLARGARDSAMAAIIMLEDLTRQNATPVPSRGVDETDGMAARLRRPAHEARLAEARTTLQQALALAH
ncbi:MAG: hypothetical protein RML45_02870 [Acetobacteraceae bacterium]|nr:hypothetical protein [Acetobacteraceae bacterium]